MSESRHLVLYDGVCAMCNALVGFAVRRDRRDRLRFASLQGDLGRAWIARHGLDPGDLDTALVVVDYEGPAPKILDRDRAALFVISRLGFPWWLAGAFRIVPRFLRRPAYNFIARRRYGWFGKFDSCPLPAPDVRHKFL